MIPFYEKLKLYLFYGKCFISHAIASGAYIKPTMDITKYNTPHNSDHLDRYKNMLKLTILEVIKWVKKAKAIQLSLNLKWR